MIVHLVDGTYELFRSFFGAPSAQDKNGREVGATRGLARSLIALLRDEQVTHLGIAFDTVIESFRNELFAGYKTGAGIEPELLNQFPLAEEVAAALGLTVWPMVEFEADDALASAAALCESDDRVERVLVCSPDKDLAQCVRGERVVLVDRRRKQTIDQQGVMEKWGVAPPSIPDYLALVGDSADGIPGIPRWGAKSTATVLDAYPRLEDIPRDVADWTVRPRGAAALAENLAENYDDALLYRTLATLRTDVPLSPLDEWQWRGADRARIDAIAAELDDEGLVGRVTKWA